MREFPRRFSLALGIVTIAALITYAVWPQPPIRVLTQFYPPYQHTAKDGTVIGTSVDIFHCAMVRMGEPYEIQMVWGQGWAAGQAAAARGEYQGFFGALHTQERDAFASWSASLGDNYPNYIRLKTTKVGRHSMDARWGVKKGSGISATVQDRALNVTFRGEDNPEVVGALIAGYVDWIYMDLEIFRWSARMNDVKDAPLYEMNIGPFTVETNYFHIEPGPPQPYGVYWTYDFLHRRPPNWMDRFNSAVGACRQKRELSGVLHILPRIMLARRRERMEGETG